MAIMKNGLIGNMSGCLGSIEGSRWKGRNVFRGRKRKSFVEPSSFQLNQRSAFASCRAVLSLVKDYAMFSNVGRGDTTLPAWPMYVKKLCSYYVANQDFYDQPAVFSKGKFKVDWTAEYLLTEWQGDYLFVDFIASYPFSGNVGNVVGIVYNKRTGLFCSESQVFIFYNSAFDFAFYGDYQVGDEIVLTVALVNDELGYCSDSHSYYSVVT